MRSRAESLLRDVSKEVSPRLRLLLKKTKIPLNCKAFCEVCGHGVYNMEKHIQTEDHKRNVRSDTLRAQEQNK